MRNLLLTLLSMVFSVLSAQTTIYHWSSTEGMVLETGGNIVQHYASMVSRINNECSGFYVITLVGRGENIGYDDGTEKSQHMEISLADDEVFKAGDIITISGMRNTTDVKANATLFMQFDNGVTIEDTNVWNNLGQYYEVTIESGTSGAKRKAGSTTEDLTIISAFPSTYSFEVPASADGCKSLRLSRDVYQCRLYLSEIDIKRNQETTVSQVLKSDSSLSGTPYNLSGRRVNANARGIVIQNGRKVLK